MMLKTALLLSASAALFASSSSNAAGCDLNTLKPADLAASYMGAAQELSRLYGLSRSASRDDMRYVLEAQGPLSSFSDATYLVTDLLRLRAQIVEPADRAKIDADLDGNLKLLGAAFYGAEDYLGHLATVAGTPQAQSEITAARQKVVDGIALYGNCIVRPAPEAAPSAPPASGH